MDIQGNQGLPKLYYRMCTSSALSNCNLDTEEVHGGKTMKELNDIEVDDGISSHLTAEFDHDPSNCEDSNYCYYMFAISNKGNDKPRTFSMRVELEFYDPGNVDLEKSY